METGTVAQLRAPNAAHVGCVATRREGPTASVAAVLVHWNCPSLLARALESLRDQSVPPARILVVDNGQSGQLDRRALPEGVEVLTVSENLGFAAANNRAVDRAVDCEWIALVNPDVTLAVDWLERMLLAAERYEGCSLLASRMLMADDPERLDGAGDVYHTSGLAWRRGWNERPTADHDEPREAFSACAAAALVRRSAWIEIGGLDEHFFCYCEDVDFGFRLQLAGRRVQYIPEAVAYHVGSATTGASSDFAVYHGHRNLVWTYWKNMPGLLFWMYLPQHLAMNLAAILWFACRGQTRTIVRAKWDALCGLPRVLGERRIVQARRKASAARLRRLMARGWCAPLRVRLRRVTKRH